MFLSVIESSYNWHQSGVQRLFGGLYKTFEEARGVYFSPHFDVLLVKEVREDELPLYSTPLSLGDREESGWAVYYDPIRPLEDKEYWRQYWQRRRGESS